MFTTRCPWGSAAVLLCALLLQDCQSSSLSITEEEGPVASSASLASAMRQRTSGELPATPSLTPPSASPTAYTPPSRLSTTPANEQNLSTAPCSHLLIPAAPSALATVGNAPTAPHDLQLVAMPRAPHAASLGNTIGHAPFSIFATASGERVRFSQVDGQWQAVVQDGSNAYTTQRTLPVVGPADIGGFLSWLQGQDRWASRARVHLLRMPQAPYSPCVYLGRVGLLGGVPTSPGQGVSQGSRTAPQEKWIQGHTIILSGNEKRTEVYHIPAGYCYKGYRIKDGSVVKRASCTIRYVEANSKEEIDRLEGYNDGSALEAKLSADFAQVMTLGTVEAGMQSAHVQGHQGAHRSSFTHAALVLYGSTKQNKMFREKSHLKLELEILVVEDITPSLNSSSTPSSFGDNGSQASQVAGGAAAEIASALPSSSASASVFSPSTFSNSKPAAQLPLTPRPMSSSSIFSDSKPVAQPVEATPVPAAPVEEPDIDLGQVHQVPNLLARKLADPGCVLSDSESIVLLTSCVAEGAENAKKVVGKGSVIVIGNTGAGKSTFVNYLLGCEMMQKTPKELGIKGIKKIVVVKSKAEGGRCDEIMPIGHAKTSKTFMPQIAVDTDASSLAYCDCPGFLDNRGAEINIANAVNIKRVLQAAEYVKVLILINYHSLLADRGRGLTDMLSICTQLFGSQAHLERCQDALLLGVTQVPQDMDLDNLKEWLVEDTPKVMETMSQRLFLYDPLDRGDADFFWSRSQCLKALASLRGIPQSESCKMFQTVLTYDDEQKLEEIVDKQSKALRKALHRGIYAEVGKCWQNLQQLGVIDNLCVERMLHRLQLRLQYDTSKRVAQFRDCVVRYHFDEAQRHLSTLGAIGRCFDEGYLDLDLNELGRYRSFFQKKQEDEIAIARRHQEEQERYAAETKRLLAVIEQQGQEMEARLSTLQSEHAQETSRLRAEMIHRGADHDEQIAKLRAENTEVLRQQAEALSLNQALNAEERAKLEAEQAQQRRAYEEKIAAAEREKALARREYDLLLAQRQETQRQSEVAIKEKISQLAAQKEEKKALLAKTSTPDKAFGAKEWEKYFGDVGAALALPSGIDAVLDSKCPFWPNKKVKDTHLLVLMPAAVDGVPFTLNLLGELIQRPKNGGHRTEYRHYNNNVRTQFGAVSPDHSYWLLITHDVLKGSRNKAYSAQRELVARHARRTGQPYEVPRALEAATAILMQHARTGERLFGALPRTYTRCQELVSGSYPVPVVVGGFESSGLSVDITDSDRSSHGVAGCRKF